MPRLLNMVMLALIWMPQQAEAQQAAVSQDLRRLSIEELLDIDITSVSRRSKPLSQTAASVEVITGDDIRRAGVTNIPEALRLFTGLQVSQVNAASWAIGVRGFTTPVGNKLLVLIDGRSVYSPLFAGSFWELQDTVLEDVDRIELVRGPGATLWGSNAVDGIINIVTKNASRTHGGFLRMGGGGAQDLGFVSARWGAAAGEHTDYRVYTKYSYRDQTRTADGMDARDPWRVGRVGFRIDSDLSPRDAYTAQGEIYRGEFGILGRADAKPMGGNLVTRWTRTVSADSDFQLQVYYDRTNRAVPLQVDEHRDTVDVDFQHRFQWRGQDLVWGAEYRISGDRTANTPDLSTTFDPQNRRLSLYSGFLQDEISFAHDRASLVAGVKLERNDYTGVEVQPNIRMAFRINSEHMLWASLSRPVRTPSRIDTDLRFRSQPLPFVGSKDFESEEMLAYEIGYRAQLHARASLDLSTFYNVYDNLRSTAFSSGPPPAIAIFNDLNARTYGGDITANYDVLERWRLHAGYALLGKTISMDPGKSDLFQGTAEGNDARHQFSLRSSLDLPHDFEFDTDARFVGRLPSPVVPRYLALDARITWTRGANAEFGVVGRNLTDAAHPEFGAPAPSRSEVRRNIYAFMNLRF